MNRQENRTYTEDFIKDALQLYDASGETFVAVGGRLGVPAATLRGWYSKRMGRKKASRTVFEQGSEAHVSETSDQKLERLERENRELRRKVDRLETDKVILKKAAAFFARESE
jgi:transposase